MVDGDGHLALRLNYDGKCILDRVSVRGRQVAAESGVGSGVCVAGKWYSTKTGVSSPKVAVGKGTVSVSDIVFGAPGAEIHENWQFTVQADRIDWRITRRYATDATLDDSAFPQWDFQNMSTWSGGILGNGGVEISKYLANANATYGAHTDAVTFWNRASHDCLRVVPARDAGTQGAVRFSDQQNDMAFVYTVSPEELKTKYDFNRYLPDRQDLWAPFKVSPGTVSATFALSAPDYDEAYDRGTLRGLDGGSVREVLNTVGRYGVIDSHLVGANGWLTGNICLHEQWFAELGLAVDDPNYDANLASTLDFERDHAISSDGRVIARWSYNAGDAMAGTFDSLGFYEAQWGYLIDSQPDYVINVAEQFDRSGDRKWLAGQKIACEKALNYLVRREVGHTGLTTVLTDSHLLKRGSDWFDITWASYENALVNAELYEALTLWADREDVLGDSAQASSYREFAARLKTSFNKPIADGGFWDPKNQWYIYWRDKDGSPHGDNLFTPLNFAAISYGLCDDPARKKAILDRTEAEMVKEKLFTWPINFFTFERDESMSRDFPFPNYENGALFLSWNELAVRAYAAYDPALAMKYIKNTLTRYEADGLAFQRYERQSQAGAADDLLSGNCMAIVGLYRDIYGVQPKGNRLLLDPHLTPELNGTQLHYTVRGRKYAIDLSTANYAATADGSTLRSAAPFGVNASRAGVGVFCRHRLRCLPVGRTNHRSTARGCDKDLARVFRRMASLDGVRSAGEGHHRSCCRRSSARRCLQVEG